MQNSGTLVNTSTLGAVIVQTFVPPSFVSEWHPVCSRYAFIHSSVCIYVHVQAAGISNWLKILWDLAIVVYCNSGAIRELFDAHLLWLKSYVTVYNG